MESLYNKRARLISEPAFTLEQTYKQYKFQYLDFLKKNKKVELPSQRISLKHAWRGWEMKV